MEGRHIRTCGCGAPVHRGDFGRDLWELEQESLTSIFQSSDAPTSDALRLFPDVQPMNKSAPTQITDLTELARNGKLHQPIRAASR